MFEVLVESGGRKRPPAIGSTAISTLIHALLMAGTVWSGHRIGEDVMNQFTETVRYLVPPDREAAPQAERLQFASSGGGSALSGVVAAPKVEATGTAIAPQPPPGAQAGDDRESAPVEKPAHSDNAFSIVEVDSQATRDPLSAAPDYPKTMMDKGVEGSAALRFVVDSTGLVDMSTVQVLDYTHPEFAKAVKDVMPRMRFRPARMGAVAVRQLAEQIFKFEIRRAPASAGPALKKP